MYLTERTALALYRRILFSHSAYTGGGVCGGVPADGSAAWAYRYGNGAEQASARERDKMVCRWPAAAAKQFGQQDDISVLSVTRSGVREAAFAGVG
jgi:hypothetical protein